MTRQSPFDPVTIQLIWNRLISIVDEAATGLMRTAYTPSVKEYHDFCCALFDRNGAMLAHSTVTTAGFLGIVPEVMRNFLARHPLDTISEGDVFITNDPWLASGHLIDISLAAPIFHRGEVRGFALCIVHHLDMGGRMSTLASQNIYEEGLKIPVLKLYEAGRQNSAIFEFLKANIRVPEKVLGDVRAQLVANNVCARGLARLLEEYGLDGLEDISTEIIGRTESSLRRKIAAIPSGTYRNGVTLPPIPGCPDEVRIEVAVTFDGDGVTVDYAGSSGEVGAAVNCTLNMTRSYTAYPFKLALDPGVWNNDGGLRPITVLAPEGSILNCRHPAATWGRTMISHMLPEIMFGALEGVMPDLVLGGNGGCPANEVYLHGRRRRDGRAFLSIAQHSGGYGGSAVQDGHACLCFPNNTRNIPVEVIEGEAPILHEYKRLLPDSGGAGRHRGGLGQEVAFSVLEGEQGPDGPIDGVVRLNNRDEAGSFPILGRRGGRPGRGFGLRIDGAPAEHGINRRLAAGTHVHFTLGGGGGYGDPLERAPDRVAEDVREGYVSPEHAASDYGVILDPATGAADTEATAEARRRRISSGGAP